MTKQTVASLAVEVDALKALVQQLVEHNTALEQRASNFAARMTTARKVMRAEITQLRDRLENGHCGVAAGPQRVPRAEFVAALAVLKAETGVGYHPAEAVRNRALQLRREAATLDA